MRRSALVSQVRGRQARGFWGGFAGVWFARLRIRGQICGQHVLFVFVPVVGSPLLCPPPLLWAQDVTVNRDIASPGNNSACREIQASQLNAPGE